MTDSRDMRLALFLREKQVQPGDVIQIRVRRLQKRRSVGEPDVFKKVPMYICVLAINPTGLTVTSPVFRVNNIVVNALHCYYVNIKNARVLDYRQFYIRFEPDAVVFHDKKYPQKYRKQIETCLG